MQQDIFSSQYNKESFTFLSTDPDPKFCSFILIKSVSRSNLSMLHTNSECTLSDQSMDVPSHIESVPADVFMYR